MKILAQTGKEIVSKELKTMKNDRWGSDIVICASK